MTPSTAFSRSTARSPAEWIELPGGIAFLLGGLLVIATLASSGEVYRGHGKNALVAALLLPGVFYWFAALGQRRLRPSRATSQLAFLVLAAASIPRISHSYSPDGWGRLLVQALLLWFFFDAVTRLRWSRSTLLMLGLIPSLWLVMLLGAWLSSGRSTPYAFVFENTNPFGASCAVLTGLSVICWAAQRTLSGRVVAGGVATTGALLVVASMSRSALLAFLVGSGVWAFWGRVTTRRSRHRGVWLAVVGACLAFVFLQTAVVEWLTDAGYQDLSRRLTGKNVGTREHVWRQIVEVIGDKPLLGHGASMQAADILGEELSAHCLYLQLMLQIGFIGLAAFLWAAWRAWSSTWQGRFDPVVRAAAACWVAVLVHQTFEVSLTQNHLGIGCVAWGVCGIACSRSEFCRLRTRRIGVAGLSPELHTPRVLDLTATPSLSS